MENKYDKLKEYCKKNIVEKDLIGDIYVSEEQYLLLVEYFIFQTNLSTHSYKLMSDPTYAIALVQIGIHYYDGKLWPHIESIIGSKTLNSIRERISTRFILTLKRYKKTIENDSEIINTILLHGFVSNHYISYLFDYLYRFYVIDIERDLTWEGYKDSLNYLVDMIQKGEEESQDQNNRKYMLVKQTVDGIRITKKQSVLMKFRWLLRTIDKLVYHEDINENSKSRLIKEFINWSKNSQNKKNFDKEYILDKNREIRKRNSSPHIIYHHSSNRFILNIPGQKFLARSGSLLKANLYIDEKIKQINLGCNELSTLIKTNDYNLEISSDDIFKKIHLEIEIDKTKKIYSITTGDPFVVFDENYQSMRIFKDRQLLSKGLNYAFSQLDTEISFSNQHDLVCKNADFKNYSFDIDESDYVVINNNKLLIPRIDFEDGIVESNKIKNMQSNGLDVYNKVPMIFFKSNQRGNNGTIVKINGEIINSNNLIKVVEEFADGSVQAILTLDSLISRVGVYEIEIDVPSQTTRKYKYVYIPNLMYEFKNDPYVFSHEGFIDFNSNSIKSKLEHKESLFMFEIDGNTNCIDFNYEENNISIPLEIKVPYLKIELSDKRILTDSFDSIWHKKFPFTMKITYPNFYSIRVENDSDNDQVIDAELHNGEYICDLTKLRTYLYEGNALYSDVFIDVGNSSFLLAKVFTTSQILEVSPLEFDIEKQVLKATYKMSGDDEIFVNIMHIETKELLCEMQNVSNGNIETPSTGLSGNYSINFFVKEKGFGKKEKIIHEEKRTLITDNIQSLYFQINNHYKGDRRFQTTAHGKKKYLTKLVKIDENIYNAQLIEYSKDVFDKTASTPVRVEIIEKDYYWVAYLYIIDEFEGDEDLIPFLYDADTKRLVLEEDRKLPSREKYRRYKDLSDYKFDLKIVEEF